MAKPPISVLLQWGLCYEHQLSHTTIYKCLQGCYLVDYYMYIGTDLAERESVTQQLTVSIVSYTGSTQQHR